MNRSRIEQEEKRNDDGGLATPCQPRAGSGRRLFSRVSGHTSCQMNGLLLPPPPPHPGCPVRAWPQVKQFPAAEDPLKGAGSRRLLADCVLGSWEQVTA